MGWLAELSRLQFTRPGALWLLGLVGLVVLAHMLRARARRHVVPDLGLWEDFLRQVEGTRRLEWVQELGSLLLRILLAAACALAAAGAYLGPPGPPPPPLHLALVMDTSASMGARDVPGHAHRLAAAVALAQDLVSNRLAPGDRWCLVTTGGVVLGFDEDPTTRLSTLLRLQPSPPGQEDDLATAVGLAEQLVRGCSFPRVLLLGDGGGAAAFQEALDRCPDLRYVAIGQGDRNAAILDVVLEEGVGERAALVRVASFASEPMEVALTGGEGEDLRLALAPGTEQLARVPLTPRAAAAVLSLGGDETDLLEDDDRAYLGLVPWSPWEVLVAADGQEELALVGAVLAALGDQVDRKRVRRTTLAHLSTLSQGPVAPEMIVVAGGELAGTPPRSSLLLLGTSAPTLGVRRIGGIPDPVAWQVDTGHPILAGVGLEELAAREAIAVELEGSFQVLAREARGQPLLAVAAREGGRRVIFCALAPSASGLGHSAAFPVLVRNALRLMWESTAATVEGAYPTGEVLQPRRPIQAGRPVPVCVRETLALADPARRLRPAPVVGDRFRFTDTARPGLYGFEIEGRWRWAGVNRPPDPRESSVRVVAGTHDLAAVTDGIPRDAPRRRLLPELLLVAICAYVADALLFAITRRRRSFPGR